MNTTKKGNDFENRAYTIIEEALNSGKLGIYSSQSRIYRKRGYFSRDRNKDIIFDLAIEVWPPEATNYALLYIIECKSYHNHRVPVDDVEEFYAKIIQVSGVNAKGIFITDSTLQESAYTYARSKGIMVIEVKLDASYKIVFHKIQRSLPGEKTGSRLETWDDVVYNFFTSLLNSFTKIEGLQRLSTEAIEAKATAILESINPTIVYALTNLPYDELALFLRKEHNVHIDSTTSLNRDHLGNKTLGAFDRSKQTIYIDQEIAESPRFMFILAHEVGHFFLHRDLKMNQQVYDSFKDSEYNFILDRHELKNEKNWIEWQANQFAASLLMPRTSIMGRLLLYQEENTIRNKGTLYYDDQSVNQRNFHGTISYLATYFQVSFTAVKFRLREIGILKGPKNAGATRPYHQPELGSLFERRLRRAFDEDWE